MPAMNEDRLRGAARDRIFKDYLRGIWTAREAALIIGVSLRTILRSSPRDFDWKAARMALAVRKKNSVRFV